MALHTFVLLRFTFDVKLIFFLPYLSMLETHSPSPYPCYHQLFFKIRSYIPHEIYSIFEYSEARRLFLSSGKEIKISGNNFALSELLITAACVIVKTNILMIPYL